MMVNDIKGTSEPWQSVIPQQMPWMSHYGPASLTTQFGQQSGSHLPNQSVSQFDSTLQNGAPLPQIQHPSVANFPTATTLTLPITVCPTSLIANNQFGSAISMPSNCVTTTTYSYPSMQHIARNSQHPTPDSFNQPNLSLANYTQAAGIYNPNSSLTQLAHGTGVSSDQTSNHKRSSMEMEDDLIKANEPPTKQLLSEKKLFKQFGSLHIDGLLGESESGSSLKENSDDSEDEEQSQYSFKKGDKSGREEFNRYVYLLFKDKKNDGKPFVPSYTSLDRLAREERDKLSKAVVLWNPPIKNFLNQSNEDDDDDDDEQFTYKDHRDFLKKPRDRGNQSVVISEVTFDEIDGDSTSNNMPDHLDTDDLMLE